MTYIANHSIKNIWHNKNTLHNFNGLSIRILHRITYISNINYTLTQAPSLLKNLGVSPCSLAHNTFQVQFY